MKQSLPTLKDALRAYEEKKREVEQVETEIASFSRVQLPCEQRRRRNHLELLLKTLKNELFLAECTLAEIKWYGEGEPA